MRFRGLLLLALLTIGLIVFGFEGIKNGLLFREPKVLTYDEFVKSHPGAGWFEIKDCLLDLTQSVYKEGSGSKAEVAYIPVESVTDAPEETDEKTAKPASAPAKDTQTHLIFETRDPGVLNTVEELKNVDKTMTEKQAQEYVLKNLNKLFITHSIQGMLEAGLTADTETRDQISKLQTGLASDYGILNDGARPNLGSGLFMLGLGTLLAICQVLYWARRLLFRRR